MSETMTFRGSSVDELLPQIREELGPAAIITCQREGITGGVAGFFGRKTVEIEAFAPDAPPAPVLPPRAVIDAYDTDDTDGPVLPSSLVDELIAQASPFATTLAEALAPEPEPAPQREPRVEELLAHAGVPPELADRLLAEAEDVLAPFAPGLALDALVRRALTRRFSVFHRGRGAHRRIALVGPAGAGRSLAAAKLCSAHARAGARVGALSLERAKAAHRLADAAQRLDLELEIAPTAAELALARRRLKGLDVVVVDTPPFDPRCSAAGRRLADLLTALAPTETHLVLAAGTPPDTAQLVAERLRAHVRVDAVLLTHADSGERPTPLGVALGARLPVSFVGSGAFAGSGIAAAEPDALARLVLP